MSRTVVLIVTDSPVLPTGRAETTRLIFQTLTRIAPGEYEIHQIALSHVLAVTHPEWMLYPVERTIDAAGRAAQDVNDICGERSVLKLLDFLHPDIVFAFNAPQAIIHLCCERLKLQSRLVVYLNWDGERLPTRLLAPLLCADRVFTMTEFAMRRLIEYLPQLASHRRGVLFSPADTRRFHPLSSLEKARAREDVLPGWMPRNAFILGWVGANRWHRQVWVVYEAISYIRSGRYHVCRDCGRVTLLDCPAACHEPDRPSEFGIEAVPESRGGICRHCGSEDVEVAQPLGDVILWLHMAESDPLQAWPVRSLERLYSVRPGEGVHYSEGYGPTGALSPPGMALLYQIWDVLLFTSGSSCFGMPAWEAMSSGLPVVYSDYSSHAEYLNASGAGFSVRGSFQPEAGGLGWRLIADVAEIVVAVRRLYCDRALCRELGENGRRFVDRYDVLEQARKWHHVFQDTLTDSPSLAHTAG